MSVETCTHSHSTYLSVFVHASLYASEREEAASKALYPCQWGAHRIVPVQVVAVIVCAVAQTKSEGEGGRGGRGGEGGREREGNQ